MNLFVRPESDSFNFFCFYFFVLSVLQRVLATCGTLLGALIRGQEAEQEKSCASAFWPVEAAFGSLENGFKVFVLGVIFGGLFGGGVNPLMDAWRAMYVQLSAIHFLLRNICLVKLWNTGREFHS